MKQEGLLNDERERENRERNGEKLSCAREKIERVIQARAVLRERETRDDGCAWLRPPTMILTPARSADGGGRKGRTRRKRAKR